MTQFFNVGGVDVPANTVRLVGGIEGLTSAADGSVAEAQCAVDDPTGSLTFLSMATFRFTETACSQPRCFTGFIHNVKIARGPYTTGPGRVWTFDIWDLNNLLHQRILRGSSAKRPAETASARVTWLLSSVGLSGLVYDNGLVMTNTSNFGAADYRHQYPDQVLQDVCVASGVTNPIFFVYWDNSAGQPSLFYNYPSAAIHDSTLSISNVQSDLSATCFAPIAPELSGSGEDVYDGVDFTYTTGNIYRQNATTYATFGIHRDGEFTTDRIGSLATAIAHADIWLGNHSGQLDTVSCTIEVPAASVNLLDAGMRVQVKFSHFPGYTSFTWTRVTRRTILLANETNEYYLLQLELSVKGVNQAGGGDPGGFPLQSPCGPAALVQESTKTVGTLTIPIASAPPNGHLLVLSAWSTAQTTSPTVPTGWTLAKAEQSGTAPPGGAGSTCVMYRVASGEGTSFVLSGFVYPTDATTNRYCVREYSGFDGGVTVVATHSTTTSSGATIAPGAVVATGESLLVTTALIDEGAGHAYGTFTPDAAYTTRFLDGPTSPSSHINYYADRFISAGSYNPTGTYSRSDAPSASLAVIFACAGASTEPPMPGQWVYGEIVTPPPNGSTTTFSTAFAFADGSLTVYVDNLDQTAAVSSFDGAAGTFTLSYAPWGTDVVKVDYQGR